MIFPWLVLSTVKVYIYVEKTIKQTSRFVGSNSLFSIH